MKIFVLSMRKSKRRDKVQKYLNQFNLNFKFCYPISNKKINILLNNIKYHKKNQPALDVGTLSCLSNHLKCIFFIYKKNLKDKNHLIIEDDIQFNINLNSFFEFVNKIPFEYDLLRIGFPTHNNQINHLVNKGQNKLNLEEKDLKLILKYGFLPNTPVLSGPAYVLSFSGVNKIGKYLSDCLEKKSSLLIDAFDWWILAAENGHFGINCNLKCFTFYKNLVEHKDENFSQRKKRNLL